LNRAEENLKEFQSRNEEEILTGNLSALKENQRDYLREYREIQDTIRNLEEILAQLQDYPPSEQVSLGDEMTALLLQIGAFGAGDSPTIELQIGGAETFSNRTVGELRVFLAGLSNTLQARLSAIESSLLEIEPQMLDLQERIQEFANENSGLIRNRDLARENYMTLARKVEETRLAVQTPSGEVRVVSEATLGTPVGPRKLLNGIVAGAFGLMLGVFGVLAWEWWSDRKEAEEPAQ
jgi:chromosome segregation ATPase